MTSEDFKNVEVNGRNKDGDDENAGDFMPSSLHHGCDDDSLPSLEEPTDGDDEGDNKDVKDKDDLLPLVVALDKTCLVSILGRVMSPIHMEGLTFDEFTQRIDPGRWDKQPIERYHKDLCKPSVVNRFRDGEKLPIDNDPGNLTKYRKIE